MDITFRAKRVKVVKDRCGIKIIFTEDIGSDEDSLFTQEHTVILRYMDAGFLQSELEEVLALDEDGNQK